MINESIEQVSTMFEQLQQSYYYEKTKKEEYMIEANLQRQQKQVYMDQIEILHQQIKFMQDSDLHQLNLKKEYEELKVLNNKLSNDIQILQQQQYQKEVQSKRQIYMLESENQQSRITIERQRQRISEMECNIENMFTKLTQTGYGELVQCNQKLLDRIANLEDQLNENKIIFEKIKHQHQEETSRQTFNYEILVQQYQTLLKENQNLIKSQVNQKNYYQSSSNANKSFYELESASPNSTSDSMLLNTTTIKKKKY